MNLKKIDNPCGSMSRVNEQTIDQLEPSNPFLIKGLHEKWGVKFELTNTQADSSLIIKKKLYSKPMPRIRRKVFNNRLFPHLISGKYGAATEHKNETLIMDCLVSHECNESLPQTVLSPLTKIGKQLKNILGFFLSPSLPKISPIATTPIRVKRIISFKVSPLLGDQKRVKPKEKLIKQAITPLHHSFELEKKERIKIRPITRAKLPKLQEKANKTQNSYFIIRMLLISCLYRISKKYKRLKKSSQRLRKYRALCKKWKLRKARKKHHKRMEQSRHRFFSPGKSDAVMPQKTTPSYVQEAKSVKQQQVKTTLFYK
ncbi:hypothetical protein [Legionella sp. km772]|uniref:hypothetical protein n=1 Tax=Legionella sp. km772 TaxID=2498111 RepID=UPI000F8EF471|nr:hypothetical protein [Legionella sp. km772]RUR07512.1 hypothetical protein ELY15_12140 [Legionella sp. km772]